MILELRSSLPPELGGGGKVVAYSQRVSDYELTNIGMRGDKQTHVYKVKRVYSCRAGSPGVITVASGCHK